MNKKDKLAELWNFLNKIFEKLWIKILIEFIFLGLISCIYLVCRYVFPKKYRITDKNITEFFKRFSIFMGNIPKKEDNILNLIDKSRTIFTSFHDKRMAKNSEVNEALSHFAKQNDLITVYDATFLLNIFGQIETRAKKIFVEEIGTTSILYKYDFGENQILYIAKTAIANTAEEAFTTYYFAHDIKFNYKKLINILLEVNDNRLYVTFADGKLVFTKLDSGQNEIDYIPNGQFIDTIVEEIKDYKSHGLQRSYIFYGNPGTGKTLAAMEISKRLTGSVVKIDSVVFQKLGDSFAKMLFENIQSEVIIVDDIDRVSFYGIGSALLHSLESIKGYKNKPTLFATVNDISKLEKAFIRPGRIETVIHFKDPTKEERKIFAKTLLKQYNLEISDSDLEKLGIATEDLSQAYIKEYCNQYRYCKSIDKIVEKIMNYKLLVGIVSTAEISPKPVDDDDNDDDK